MRTPCLGETRPNTNINNKGTHNLLAANYIRYPGEDPYVHVVDFFVFPLQSQASLILLERAPPSLIDNRQIPPDLCDIIMAAYPLYRIVS